MLTGLRMELASIARIHGDSESEISSRIARAKGTVEQTLRIVRNIAMLLRPSMLDDLGLAPALAWLFKEVARSSGFEMHSDIDPAVDALPEAHRTCIYPRGAGGAHQRFAASGAREVQVSLQERRRLGNRNDRRRRPRVRAGRAEGQRTGAARHGRAGAGTRRQHSH